MLIPLQPSPLVLAKIDMFYYFQKLLEVSGIEGEPRHVKVCNFFARLDGMSLAEVVAYADWYHRRVAAYQMEAEISGPTFSNGKSVLSQAVSVGVQDSEL